MGLAWLRVTYRESGGLIVCPCGKCVAIKNMIADRLRAWMLEVVP